MSTSASAIMGTGPMPNWTWQQSMIRIKDPEKSLAFYRDVMGCTLVDKYDFPQWGFSLYFMQSLPKGQEYTLEPGSDEAHKVKLLLDRSARKIGGKLEASVQP